MTFQTYSGLKKSYLQPIIEIMTAAVLCFLTFLLFSSKKKPTWTQTYDYVICLTTT